MVGLKLDYNSTVLDNNIICANILENKILTTYRRHGSFEYSHIASRSIN